MSVVAGVGLVAEMHAATADLRAEILAHPFVVGMGDGTLPADRFAEYLRQDVHYLGAYARVLGACAAQAGDADDAALWAGAAARTVAIERELHLEHVNAAEHAPSPTCAGYSRSLEALAAEGSYPVLVAGVLPCYTVYAEVGAHLLTPATERPGGIGAHPYGRWLAMWGGPEFRAACVAAQGAVDRAGAGAPAEVRERMDRAYRSSVLWELRFWDAAWRLEPPA